MAPRDGRQASGDRHSFLETSTFTEKREETLAPVAGPVDSSPPWLLDGTALHGERQGIG